MQRAIVLHPTRRQYLVVALANAALAASAFAQNHPEQRYPDIVSVKARSAGPDTFDFDVTVSSLYDTPARDADGVRVVTLTGEVLGERKLLHDHQTEQPFTRDLHGVKIPRAVRLVMVQGRDQRHGYGGKAVQVQLPAR